MAAGWDWLNVIRRAANLLLREAVKSNGRATRMQFIEAL
jgi:hypothetical protein